MFQSIAPILSALGGGWSAKTIVKQLAKKFPKLSPFISKAESAGFLAPSILRSLMGKDKDIDTHESEITERRKQTKKNVGMAALGAGVGLTALLTRAGAATAATQAAQALPPGGGGGGTIPPGGGTPPTPPPAAGRGGLLAPIPGGPIPTPGVQPQPLIPTGGPAMTPSQQASQVRHQKYDAMANNLPTKTETQFPQLPNFVKRMQEAGKSPEETYELAKQSPSLGPLVQKVEQEIGQPYLERIKQNGQQQKVGAMAQFTATKPEQQASADVREQTIPSPAKEGSVVMTPAGAGEVHKTHGNDAYIEVDQKLQKIPLDQLEKPPEDVVKAVSDILQIPEIDRSSNVSLFVYDPDESRAYFQFHDGSVYRYNNIDPQVVQDIAAKNATPITSGQNVYGAWSPEDPHGSLGAAFWAYLLKDPKYAKNKKGQPENTNYKKLQTLYDYWVKLRKRKK